MTNRDMARNTPRGIMPFSDVVNQLLHDAFITPFGSGAGSMMVTGMNLYETDDSYIVQMPIPGMQPDQLNITVRDNLVTVQGATEIPAPEGARSLQTGTMREQIYERVQLPSDVDSERATATYEDGILTLTLPKATSARTRRIRVVNEDRGRRQQGQGQQRSQDRDQVQAQGLGEQQAQGQPTGQGQGRQGQGQGSQGSQRP